jgi:asparagine synthase (glutamine-hydrolysing)
MNENTHGNKPAQFFQKTKDGKQILRDVMRRYIPEDIANAEKQGFSAPDSSWFKGESIEFVKHRLLNTNAHIYKWVDPQTIRELVNEHLDGKQNRRLLIWSLLNLDTYMEQVLEGRA